MRFSRFAALFLACFLMMTPAAEAVTVIYTGAQYSDVSYREPDRPAMSRPLRHSYGTDMHATLTFDLDGPLLADTEYSTHGWDGPTITSMSAHDGINVFGQDELFGSFVTDSAARITGWYFVATRGSVDLDLLVVESGVGARAEYYYEYQRLAPETLTFARASRFGDFFTAEASEASTDASGSWRVVNDDDLSMVPLPATGLLYGVLSLGLFGALRRRV